MPPPWALLYSQRDRQGHCWQHQLSGIRVEPRQGLPPPSTLELPGQRLAEPVAPPSPRPGPGLGLAGGGASEARGPELSPLVVAAAGPERTGAEAAEAEVPPAGRGCGAVLDSRLLRPRPLQCPRLRARWATACATGGAAAGLPRHPGERQGGLPLVPQAMSVWLGVKGRVAAGLAAESSGSGWGTVVLLPTAARAPGPGVPGWTVLSASNQCPAVVSFARAQPPRPLLTRADLRSLVKISERAPAPTWSLRRVRANQGQSWVIH